MNRAKSICRKPGCNRLLDRPGYCTDHQPDPGERFESLERKKTPEERKFYSSQTWTKVSKNHRRNEPLCRRCKAAGKTVAGSLVHHNPPLAELLSRDLSPFDDQYLETLCFNCHQKELLNKKNQNVR